MLAASMPRALPYYATPSSTSPLTRSPRATMFPKTMHWRSHKGGGRWWIINRALHQEPRPGLRTKLPGSTVYGDRVGLLFHEPRGTLRRTSASCRVYAHKGGQKKGTRHQQVPRRLAAQQERVRTIPRRMTIVMSFWRKARRRGFGVWMRD